VAFKIFYAWQSDQDSKLTRNLIRSALKAALKNLKSDPDIHEADRDIELDHDTKGVTGSPLIAETILGKIRECDVFVADLTLISAKQSRRPTPQSQCPD
jgi:hypothetical protein